MALRIKDSFTIELARKRRKSSPAKKRNNNASSTSIGKVNKQGRDAGGGGGVDRERIKTQQIQQVASHDQNVSRWQNAVSKLMRFQPPRLSTVTELEERGSLPSSDRESRMPSAIGAATTAGGSSMSSGAKGRKMSSASAVSSSDAQQSVILPAMQKLKPWQLGRARAKIDPENVEAKRKLGPQNIRFVYSESVEKGLKKRGVHINIGRMSGWSSQFQLSDNCQADIDQLSDIHEDAIRRAQRVPKQKGRWTGKLPQKPQISIIREPIREIEQTSHQNLLPSTARTEPSQQRRVSFAEQSIVVVAPRLRPKTIEVSGVSSTAQNEEQEQQDQNMCGFDDDEEPELIIPEFKRPQPPWKLRGFTKTSAQPISNTTTPSPTKFASPPPIKYTSLSPQLPHTPTPLSPTTKPTKFFLTDLEVVKKLPRLTKSCPSIVYKTGKVAVFAKVPDELKRSAIGVR